MTREEFNAISSIVIGCAIEVHKELGPGLLESVYEVCLTELLLEKGLKVERQKQLPVFFRGVELNKDFYIDLLIEDEVIIELKSVDGILPIHEAQLLTYLKLANKKLGLMINFNVVVPKQGLKRMVNGTL